jgi:myo-inositol-1(or 4)-monophosphatase
VPDFVEAATQIAREAGGILSELAQRRANANSRAFDLKGDFDLVTEADRASEKWIVGRLRELFPTHSIVAEEGGGAAGGSGYCWYVDPLDGTTNFAHGFPVYNVTLGLEKDGELIAGAIFDPTRDEMFAASKGGGAYLNERKIAVSETARIEDGLFATGFPSRKRHLNINVHFYYQLAMLSHGVRRAGAAAIDLAYVACGRLDAFWEFGLNSWDMAAGILLIEEAGGRVTTMRGDRRTVRSADLLATNGRLHPEVIGLFGDIFAGRPSFPLPDVSIGS